MMKKNGFISTTLVYTFFIIFLTLMIFLLNSYSKTRYLLAEYKYDIKNNFSEVEKQDINVFIKVWNTNTLEYEYANSIPDNNYVFKSEYSYCKEGSTITYSNGKLIINAKEKDSCYAFFGLN